MSWIIAAAISLIVLMAFRFKGSFPRSAFELALVAVLVALAGYSWQGRPDMPGNPAASITNIE
jgi:hypothetical protein